jgi:ubiquinone/menaquinone biosynthesis C-methylase UbiE
LIRRFLARQFARPSGWAGRWWIGPWLNRIGRAMNRLALEQLELRPHDDVLEVGFGGGELLGRILAATSGDVFAVDISAAMVERARRRFAGRERLHLHRAPAASLPLTDAAVDKACSVNALYFWQDPAVPLSELARVLRPRGRLVLCFQSPAAVRAWPGHVHGFAAYEVEAIIGHMEQAGFGPPKVSQGSHAGVGDFVCLTSERI